jgi:magnesium transporter
MKEVLFMVILNQNNRDEYTRAILDALKAEDMLSFRNLFLELHPTDQTEIFTSRHESERRRLYGYLSAEEFAGIFQGLELEQQSKIVQELELNYAAEMFSHMYADDVADFLGELDRKEQERFLEKMTPEDREDVVDLLAYPEDSAGSIMTPEFISVSTKDRVADVMTRLKKEGPSAETIYYLYVVDEAQKLVGVLSLRDLIVSPDHELVENVMGSRVVSVSASADREDVAEVIKKYDFLAVPVVTAKDKLVGIITVDDIMDVIEEETNEDIGELAAFIGATDLNISAFASARKRSPWIILLMFLGLITAGVIDQFEETLEAIVILAAFIPLIMDSAGNTGTQSLAVVVRGLALGTIERAGLGQLLKREFGTGLMLGLICAVVIALAIPLFPFLEGSWMLGAIVGFSIFCALSVATIVGALIPLIINKLRIDPAVASGPFITTINDILGLLIYFSIATAFLDYLL